MSDSNPQLMEKIFVRDAVREDANEIAGLIVYAWPVQEFLDMRPGMTVDGFIQFIQSFVEAEGTLYSYENTKVAVLSDDNGKERIVGAMNAYDGSLYSTLKQPILDRMAAEFGSDDDFRATVETEAGEFYLDSVAVDPQMRSKGIGSMLFEAAFERARESGFDKVGLIVDEDKPKAEALYLRLGFRQAGIKDFFGHRMKHMQKDVR